MMHRRERGGWRMRRNGVMVSEREENGRGKGGRFEGIGCRMWRVVAERRVGTDGSVMGVGKILEWEDCSWAESLPYMDGRDIGERSDEIRDRT